MNRARMVSVFRAAALVAVLAAFASCEICCLDRLAAAGGSGQPAAVDLPHQLLNQLQAGATLAKLAAANQAAQQATLAKLFPSGLEPGYHALVAR